MAYKNNIKELSQFLFTCKDIFLSLTYSKTTRTVAPLKSLKKVKLYASISLCKSAPLASKEFAEKNSKAVKIISTNFVFILVYTT